MISPLRSKLHKPLKTYYVEELDANVYSIESPADYKAVYDVLAGTEPIAVDTETTGLDIFTPSFAVRLVQLGTADRAYVWTAADHPALTKAAVTTRHVWYANAAYDLLALDRCGEVSLEESVRFAVDVLTLARLLDPRTREVGGIGHELKQLAEHHLNVNVADARKKVEEEGRRLGLTKDEVWALMPVDNDIYRMYGGSDTILTVRLAAPMRMEIKSGGQDLNATKEHRLAAQLMFTQRRGWLCDREYAQAAKVKFDKQFYDAEKLLAELGIEPVKGSGNYYSSKSSITDKMQSLGVQFRHFTDKTQAPALNEASLKDIASRYTGSAKDIAETVLAASAAQKNSHTFMAALLHYSEYDGRVHGSINPLGARTGRMSSSRPNMQNFPRGVEETRGSLLADEGEVLISVDFSGVEFRVAAGVTGDENMKRIFADGGDIHWQVARMVYGPNATKDDRQVSKIIALGRAYGGGVKTLCRQTGAPEAAVQAAVEAIDNLYPGIKAMSRTFYDLINGPTKIKTATGKIVIADSAHLALNYCIQGPARDLLADAIDRLWSHPKGYGAMIRGVIHDEVVMSVPAEDAYEIKQEVMQIMESDFRGVHISADGNVLGRRWVKV